MGYLLITRPMGEPMMVRSLLIAALMTPAVFGSARAADLPMPEPVYKAPPPPVFSWTGCYIGAGGGYGMWNQDGFVTVGGVPLTASETGGGAGWFGQGQFGCDYQFTAPIWNVTAVVGAFGDYEAGSLTGNASTIPGLVGNERESAAWAAGARLGALVSPRVLAYVDGGWSQANFDSFNYSTAIAGGGATGISLAAQTYNGWFVGSGFEYAFDWLPVRGLFLKTEYRYGQYGRASVPLTGPVGAGSAALDSLKSNQMVSTELVWRFNWWGY